MVKTKEQIIDIIDIIIKGLSKKSNNCWRSRHQDTYGTINYILEENDYLYFELYFQQQSLDKLANQRHSIIRKKFTIVGKQDLTSYYETILEELISILHYGLEYCMIFPNLKFRENFGYIPDYKGKSEKITI